ncbi:tyrosine-type recombinase/integrase [bacterium]|nr:tyrosine-type recombinase/integrase [bacterium]
MASIYKRGKTYQIQYLENGKLVQRSLGVTTKDAAKKLEADFIKDRDQFLAGIGQRRVSNDEAFKLFFGQVVSKKSPPWQKRMTQHFHHFQDWLKSYGKASFAELKANDIEEFLAARRPVIADKTLNDELATVRVFFQWAEDREYVKKNPALKVKRVKVDPKPIRVFTSEEVHLIMKHATDYQRPFYQLLLLTGLRDGELRNLEWADVDLERRQINVRIKSDWQPKTRRNRIVPMAREARELFHELPRRGKYVFTTSNAKRWAPPRQPWVDLLDRILKKEGVDLRGQVSLHTFRHTFATHCLMNDVNIKMVSEFLGHTSVKMTEKYLHLQPEHKAREMTKVSFANLLAGGHDELASY